MDNILIAVTGLSLAMAAGMGALLARMLREERRRSDARVALLEQLAAEPAPRATVQHDSRQATVQHGSTPQNAGHGSTRSNTVTKPATVQHGSRQATVQHGSTRVEPRFNTVQHGSETPVSLDDFEIRPGGEPSGAGEPAIFQEHEAPSAWPRRLAVVGAMAVVLTAAVFGWSALTQTDRARPEAALAQTGAPPLELLSLQYAQQDGQLVISGLVQNPKTGPALARIQATVLLFGPDGQMVTSGRAPLDFTTLAAGDESPFVIRVPVAGGVTRYRVGFRGDDGRVLAHVDRRPADALARKQAP